MSIGKCVGMLLVVTGMLGLGLAEPAGAKGMLTIQTAPENAEIYINGQHKGNSPATAGGMFASDLDEGKYVVEAMIRSGDEIVKYGVKGDIYLADDTTLDISLQLDGNVDKPGPALREQLKKQYPSGPPVPGVVDIPGGTFVMGCEGDKDCSDNEKPAHRVTVSSFAMGTTEVTFRMWDACVAYGGCDNYPSDQGWGRGDRPVINVSWKDVQQYIRWLNSVKNAGTWRLPTEAEWEYAARAGSTTAYSWGNSVDKGNANCDGCGGQGDSTRTTPVGSFRPNAWGLHGMHGNVWEWCQDWYGANSYSQSQGQNPQGPGTGRNRVIRGGGWNCYPRFLRSANRFSGSPDTRASVLGFRLVRTK